MFTHPCSTARRRPVAARRAAERDFALSARLVQRSRLASPCGGSLLWACHLLQDDELWFDLHRDARVDLAAFGFCPVRPPAALQEGDLVLYFKNRVPCHVGVGRAGERVESAWARGRVFLHAAEDAPWGDAYVVYRRAQQVDRKRSVHE